jgi:hypothetical protein
MLEGKENETRINQSFDIFRFSNAIAIFSRGKTK